MRHLLARRWRWELTSEQKERLLAARTYLLAQMMEIIQERTAHHHHAPGAAQAAHFHASHPSGTSPPEAATSLKRLHARLCQAASACYTAHQVYLGHAC